MPEAATITKEQCVRNCRLTKLALIVPALVSKKVSWALSIPDCAACGRGDSAACGECMWAMLEQLGKNIPLVSELYDLHQCDSECRDPVKRSKYVCQSSLTLCAGTSVSFFGRTRPVWISWGCNQTQGMWEGLPAVHYCEQYESCVPGYVSDTGSPCKYCEDRLIRAGAVAGQDSCQAITAAGGTCGGFSGPEIRPAGDPNAKYGPAGDVLPGQEMAYTITYENQGEGEAYGVYIVDDLDPSLDDSTLVLQGTGQYYPSTRTIIWSVGALAPKGQTGSSGSVGFTVRLKPALPDGTVVINKAVVYFPSVPEETPTNPVVHVVRRAAALPQHLETPYGQPLAIVLQGRAVNGAAFTYGLDALPLFGTLTGTPPNITYTPAAGFTGPDSFTFWVEAGGTRSRSAEVQVQVVPSATYDQTPPQVLWTDPAADASAVAFSAIPLFTDADGPAYAPFLMLGMSEALDPETVTTANINLRTAAGGPIAITASFDALLNRVVIVPRQPLGPGAIYRGAAGPGLADLSGNAMGAEFTWSFRTQGEAGGSSLYLPLIQRTE
jgi:hypothetical protein